MVTQGEKRKCRMTMSPVEKLKRARDWHHVMRWSGDKGGKTWGR